MAKKAALIGLATVLAASGAPAAEFPLERKTIAAEYAAAAPGGGPVGALNKKRPREIAHEPKAVSSDPLYGVAAFSKTSRERFRMDESNGTGKGYDRLIVDLNDNGDLRDDPVYEAAHRVRSGALPEKVVFGPIDLPADKKVGPWRPSVYAVAEIRADEVLLFPTRDESAGILRVKPGWYLEATVDVDGVKEKIGIVDADRDLKLAGDGGDGSGKYVRIDRSDAVLRDRDGSGRFELGLCESEIDTLTELIGIGRHLYELALAGDFRSIRLERYRGPVGRLSVAGRPDKICALTLLSKESGNREERFRPALIDGTSVLPVGRYELQSCVVAATGSGEATAMSWAWKYGARDTIEIKAGKTTTLRCGPPIDLRVKAGKSTVRGITGGASVARAVEINVALFGTAGEQYVRHVKGQDRTIRAAPPRFKILDESGNVIASGQLEYG